MAVNDEAGIASNLTVTFGDFANLLHTDGDESPYTFGIWMTTDDNGNIIHDADTIKNGIKGGEFIWHDFGCGADFGACNGFVELIWRGKLDMHGTVQSTTTGRLKRWGSSIQVANSLERGSNRLRNNPSLQVADLPNRFPGWTLPAFLETYDGTAQFDWRGLGSVEGTVAINPQITTAATQGQQDD
jgi:hypothetical protein